MTTACPDTSLKTVTPLMHSCGSDDVALLGPLGSDSDVMFVVVGIGDACFVHLLLWYALNAVVSRFKSGKFGGEMNFGISFQDLHGIASIGMMSTFIITLCCASSDGTFCCFSVTLNIKMNCTRNYEDFLNLVRVMPKVLVVPFFPDTVYKSPAMALCCR